MVHQHRRALVRYGLRRLEEPADVDDLVADTFVAAWRRLDSAPERSVELFWLYGIARRVLANQTRGRTRSLRLEVRLAAERQIDNDEPRFDESDLAALMRALARLSPDEREVVELAYWERLSYREIGLVVDCSEKNAGVRLSRARNKLRALVTAELTGGAPAPDERRE